MTRISDHDRKKVVEIYLDGIENSIEAARRQIAAGANGRADLINMMLRLIAVQVREAQVSGWPDPVARAAQAAKQDPALQKLIKRASKPTLIRASKTNNARAAG